MGLKVQIFSNVAGDADYFTAWSEALRKDGWDVQVVASVSGPDYRRARTPWQRFRLRWRMYAAYAALLVRACRQEPDAIRIVTTNPFFAPWLALRFPGKRARVIVLLYDVWPDALRVGGKHGLRMGTGPLMAKMTRQSLQNAHAVVYLGERLRACVEAKYGPAKKSRVIPVGAECGAFGNVATEISPEHPLNVMYGGQMGAMHDLGALRDLILGRVPGDLRPLAACRFRFYASGSTYEQLKALAESKPLPVKVQWEGPLDREHWAAAMREAAIGLVTLRNGAEQVAMPSKAFSAMAAGQALVAIAPAPSDLADLVRRHDCGWVVEPGDGEGLRRALVEAVEHPDILLEKRRNAQAAARGFYDVAVVGRSWSALLREVAA